MSDNPSKVREGWKGPGRGDGEIEPLKLSEDGLHLDPRQRGAYEWWYFDAHLDSGHTLVVFFHAANPNPGLEGKTGVEILVLPPEGARIQRFVPYDKSQFRAAQDHPEVRIGSNTIRVEEQAGGLPVYAIHVQEGALGCDLRYRAQVNGWKPGSGLSHFEGIGFFGWVVPFARASVEGSITVGGTTLQVTGVGYHDHNWLNFSFPTIIRYWMWGRIYSKNYTVAYAYIQCNQKVNDHTVKVLMLARGREVVLSTGEFELTQEDLVFNPQAKHRYPRKIVLSAPGALRATLQVRKVLEAQDLLEAFHPVLRVLARWILRIRPGYFRLLSGFTLEVPPAELGAEESGTTLHEIVLFQPLD